MVLLILSLIHSHESGTRRGGKRKEPLVIGGGGGGIFFPAPDSRVLSRPALLATRNGAVARRLWF